MFELDWGLSPLHHGVVEATVSPHGAAICPCCRRALSRSPAGRFLHPGGSCSAAAVLCALAMRVGLAACSGPAPASASGGGGGGVLERCVCCGEGASSFSLVGGGPGGGMVVWSGPEGALFLGDPPEDIRLQRQGVWVRPEDLLRGRWWAAPRRKCAVCATAEADWALAHRRWQEQVQALRGTGRQSGSVAS